MTMRMMNIVMVNARMLVRCSGAVFNYSDFQKTKPHGRLKVVRDIFLGKSSSRK